MGAFDSKISPSLLVSLLIRFLLCLSFSMFLKWEGVSVFVVIPSGRLRWAPRQQLVVNIGRGVGGDNVFDLELFFLPIYFSPSLVQHSADSWIHCLLAPLTSSARWSVLSPAMLKIKALFSPTWIIKWKMSNSCVRVCVCPSLVCLFSDWSLSCWHTFPQHSQKKKKHTQLDLCSDSDQHEGANIGTGSWSWTAAVKPVGPVCD